MIQVFELNYSEVYGNGKYDLPLFNCLTPGKSEEIPEFEFEEINTRSRDYVTVKLRLENREPIELFPGDWVTISGNRISIVADPTEEMRKLLLGDVE